MKIRKSGEDYLEAILILERQPGAVRSIDLARHMGYSKASISHATSALRNGSCLIFLNALRPLFYCCLICYNRDTDFSERTVYDLRWPAVRVRTSTGCTGRTNFFREKMRVLRAAESGKAIVIFCEE